MVPRSTLRVLAALSLALCGLPAHAADPRFPTAAAAAQYHVMAGELAALRQMPEAAAESFMKALDQVPDAQLAMRATSMALAAKNERLALKAAKRWQAIDDNNLDAREAVARLALRNGDPKEARAQCDAVIKGHPGGPEEGFRQVALLLSQENGRREEALAIMEQLRRQWPDLAGAFYAQSLLAMRFNQLDLAEHAARESLRLKAGSRDALLLLTGVLVKKGDVAAAERSFADLLEGSDNRIELRMGYARLLLDGDRRDDARRQFEAILAEKPDYAEARYALGLLALEQEDLDAAETHFKELLKAEGFQVQAAYYLGRIAEVARKYPAALAWYEQVGHGELAIDAVIHRAYVLGKLKRLPEGRALLAEMRDQLPALSTRFYLAEGELLLEANAIDEALALYEQALATVPDDADLLYGRSLVHERMDNLGKAEADLRKILASDKDDSRALNALGYMLTVHTDRLKEARQLVARALELSPDDAAVIDSMGWIEFRAGNAAAARALLEKAFGKIKDPEIAAHLGEVLWTMGDRDRAKSIWEAALDKDPEHRVLRDTVERLTR